MKSWTFLEMEIQIQWYANITQWAQQTAVVFSFNYFKIVFLCVPRGAVAQSVERATPSEEVLGSIPAVGARSLLVGSMSV